VTVTVVALEFELRGNVIKLLYLTLPFPANTFCVGKIPFTFLTHVAHVLLVPKSIPGPTSLVNSELVIATLSVTAGTLLVTFMMAFKEFAVMLHLSKLIAQFPPTFMN
jgi:hypothetical protein